LALTPMIMVMLNLAHPGTGTDSFLRILHTIIGGVLAIVAGYLLFPLWERSKLPSQLAEAYLTTSLFLQALFALGKERLSVTEMRKKSGLAVANGMNAGQRLLSEPPHLRGDVEPVLATINFCRDIFYSLSAIAHLPKEKLEQIRSATVQPVARELANDLDKLGASLQSGQPPNQLPKDFALLNGWEDKHDDGDGGAAPEKGTNNSWIQFYLHALVDQVKLAHEAVVRLERNKGL
jgi:uncharacterized membrane protein YccC